MNTLIHEYSGGRDREVADLILSIQNGEAGLSLSVKDQPDLLDITGTYRDGGFWIAIDDRETIVGTVGLLAYGGTGVLKKFFVAAAYRGRGGPAFDLLDHLLHRARELGMTNIILDTPAVATRSHAFYARNGFMPASPGDLPVGYAYPDRDSLLFRRQLKRSIMSQEENVRLAGQLLAGIGQGADPNEIAALFSVDVRFEIAGDVGALPWIGRKTGRAAVVAFIRDQRDITESVRFEVEGIMADNNRAVIIGELASRIKPTGKIIETAFALILTVMNGQITRFQMLEDSFAASRAAQLESAQLVSA